MERISSRSNLFINNSILFFLLLASYTQPSFTTDTYTMPEGLEKLCTDYGNDKYYAQNLRKIFDGRAERSMVEILDQCRNPKSIANKAYCKHALLDHDVAYKPRIILFYVQQMGASLGMPQQQIDKLKDEASHSLNNSRMLQLYKDMDFAYKTCTVENIHSRVDRGPRKMEKEIKNLLIDGHYHSKELIKIFDGKAEDPSMWYLSYYTYKLGLEHKMNPEQIIDLTNKVFVAFNLSPKKQTRKKRTQQEIKEDAWRKWDQKHKVSIPIV